MEHTQSVDLNVFYDPSLALHLSRGWKLAQMLQGRVATLTSNRFVVKVKPFSRPATENAKSLNDPTVPGNVHCSGVLDGMTVCDLKKIVVAEYNAKAKAHHDKTSLIDVASGCDDVTEAQKKSNQSTTENNLSSSGVFIPINEDLATLSWGSGLLAPEEKRLSEFGLSDAHQGATLVLETYASWADKLNAMTFAIADKKIRAGLSEIVVDLSADEVDQSHEKNMSHDSTAATNQNQERRTVQQASDEKKCDGSDAKKYYSQDGNTPKMSEDSLLQAAKEHDHQNEAKREEGPKEGSNEASPMSRRSSSSTPSFTSSDDEDEKGAENTVRGTGEKRRSDDLNLNETFVKGRPADRSSILRALEARLSKVQVGQ